MRIEVATDVRIGIDARELCGRPTGVGRYLEGLLRQWATSERARRHEFVLYAPDLLTVSLDTRRFATRVVTGHGGTEWEQRQLPKAMTPDHLDVFFAPGYTAPLLTRVPTVVAVHDVSFAAHPEWFTPREGLKRRLLCRRAARRARAVLTISEFSHREIVERLRVPEERVHVIRPGVTSPLPEVRSPKPDSTTASVLYVGSIFTRRHVPDLVRAFAHVVRVHPDATLDIVGDNRTHPVEDLEAIIRQQSLHGQVRWHRYVSEEDLAAFYRRARAFAFLSEYEGLGFTPLEALACGVPSVLLDTAIARESCGSAALYVATNDVRGTASALTTLLQDEATRARLLAEAPAVLARFNWATAAQQTLEVLERAS